jgi:hypothetical protein
MIMKASVVFVLFTAVLAAGVAPRAQAATASVTPAAISNQFSGTLSLQLGGVGTGAEVRVQIFRDFDGNGAVDAGDVLVKQFSITDGVIPTIGGRTNSNVPGDLDGAANGAIAATLDYRNLTGLDHVAGKYVFQISSPTAAFAPVLTPFTITPTAFPQSVAGTVTGASNCVVVLINAAVDSNTALEVMAGTVVNTDGSYSIRCPVGQFKALAVQAGSVTDLGNAPTVSIGAGQVVMQDLSFLNPDRVITGTLLDGPAGAPLPGVQVIARSGTGMIVAGTTDALGIYSLAVDSGVWNLDFSGPDLAKAGCLAFLNDPSVDATGGSTNVTVNTVRATGLIQGRVVDETNQPVVGAYVGGWTTRPTSTSATGRRMKTEITRSA